MTPVVCLWIVTGLSVIVGVILPRTRSAAGSCLKVAAMLFFLLAWVKGLVVLASYGTLWIILGLVLSGCTVIPFAAILAAVRGSWEWLPLVGWTVTSFALLGLGARFKKPYPAAVFEYDTRAPSDPQK